MNVITELQFLGLILLTIFLPSIVTFSMGSVLLWFGIILALVECVLLITATAITVISYDTNVFKRFKAYNKVVAQWLLFFIFAYVAIVHGCSVIISLIIAYIVTRLLNRN